MDLHLQFLHLIFPSTEKGYLKHNLMNVRSKKPRQSYNDLSNYTSPSHSTLEVYVHIIETISFSANNEAHADQTRRFSIKSSRGQK